MKQEKVILSFIMVLIGLMVAGAAFYFYKTSKNPQPNYKITLSPTPTPTKKENVFLKIISPNNEVVVTNKNIQLTGETNPNATVIILLKDNQLFLKTDESGKFNTSLTLGNDQNLITIISILPSGESKEIQDTFTYSTSNF